MVSSQDLAPGDEAVLPVDAEALRKYTREQDWRDLRATCELVPPLPFSFLPEPLPP